VIARAAVQDLLHRLADAAPAAWRHDPVFRGATVAAGVTLALFLLRVAGPHAPDLDRPDLATTPPALRQSMPTLGVTPLAAQPPADVPKIAPGHPLADVAVAPTPSADRFGTFKAGPRP
jgi:hypothetical protein